jgi:hypothetical protein
MGLTEEQKKKIEEEEHYRAQVRSELKEKPKKKGMSLFTKIILIVIGGPILLMALMIGLANPQGSTDDPNSTPNEKPELVGHINFDGAQFHISNQENVDWEHCYFTLNGNYNYPSDPNAARLDRIAAGQTTDIHAGEFTMKDGTRFNPYQIKPKGMSAYCDGRTSYWAWN